MFKQALSAACALLCVGLQVCGAMTVNDVHGKIVRKKQAMAREM